MRDGYGAEAREADEATLQHRRELDVIKNEHDEKMKALDADFKEQVEAAFAKHGAWLGEVSARQKKDRGVWFRESRDSF
ncbi:uncharacterized protein K444DRAFT_612739 [Hyaloscypha bicolor E]|uniref:Uncharacterized protein n=1 Tax=Hyaloscypha bicolor E TaxID=1095630 RepID=A0A2J6TAS2_9HELO|nr:uncharacterized protein K444DRAFT_612739 [Hyaloscypha bicolor E]PMD60101.1 hypothetical protein K444DRAFT_612739 [Hyaloscypha bicolor E]